MASSIKPVVREITKEPSFLFGLLRHSPLLASRFHSPIASFDPYSFILNVAPPACLTQKEGGLVGFSFEDMANDLSSELSSATTIDEKVSIAIRSTAWMHELQHFRDCLFTPSGAYIFLLEAQKLHAIVAKLAEMRKQGKILKHPLRQASNFLADGNRAGFEISAELFDFFTQRSLFNGDLASLLLPYSQEFDDTVGLVVSMNPGDRKLKVPFFPKRAYVDGEMSILAEPIGFRAITEARATHMQNEIVSMVDQGLVTHLNNHWRDFSEYSTANMMITKSVKLTGAINEYRTPSDFSADYWRWLFHSLHGGGNSPAETSIGYPGQIALQLAADNVGREGFVHDTYSKDEADINLHLQNMIQESITHFGSNQHFVPVILRFAADHWLIPALKRYRDHKDTPVDRDHPLEANSFLLDADDRLIEGQPMLPNPIAYFHNGELEHRAPFEDSTFRSCWYFWIATRQNLSEAWDSTELTCPLARGDYKALLGQAVEALSNHCYSGIKNNSCGSLTLGTSAKDHPDCPWKRHLQHIGMIAT